MYKNIITIPLLFALISALFFALTVCLFVIESHFTLMCFVISLFFSVISLIGNIVQIIKKKITKQTIASVILSLIPFCFIVWAHTSVWLHLRQHSKGHGSVYTLGDMRKFAWAVQYFANETETEVPQQLDKIFQALYEYEEYPMIFTRYNDSEDLKEGRWIDYWGRPIRLVVSSPTEYKLISNGFNGKDDQGEKDDLIMIFNPQKVGEIEHNKW